jgi:hypothetical protein
VNKGVNIPPRDQISPLGARGEVKNGPLIMQESDLIIVDDDVAAADDNAASAMTRFDNTYGLRADRSINVAMNKSGKKTKIAQSIKHNQT